MRPFVIYYSTDARKTEIYLLNNTYTVCLIIMPHFELQDLFLDYDVLTECLTL